MHLILMSIHNHNINLQKITFDSIITYSYSNHQLKAIFSWQIELVNFWTWHIISTLRKFYLQPQHLQTLPYMSLVPKDLCSRVQSMLRICEDDGVTEMLLCCRACMSRWTSLESLAAHQRCMCNWKRNRERKREKKEEIWWCSGGSDLCHSGFYSGVIPHLWRIILI